MDTSSVRKRADTSFTSAGTWVGFGARKVPDNDAIELRLGRFVWIFWYWPAPPHVLTRREWVLAEHGRIRGQS